MVEVEERRWWIQRETEWALVKFNLAFTGGCWRSRCTKYSSPLQFKKIWCNLYVLDGIRVRTILVFPHVVVFSHKSARRQTLISHLRVHLMLVRKKASSLGSVYKPVHGSEQWLNAFLKSCPGLSLYHLLSWDVLCSSPCWVSLYPSLEWRGP